MIWEWCAKVRSVTLLILLVAGQLVGDVLSDMDRLIDFGLGLLFFWFASGEFFGGLVSGQFTLRWGKILHRERHPELFLFYLCFMGFLWMMGFGVTLWTTFVGPLP